MAAKPKRAKAKKAAAPVSSPQPPLGQGVMPQLNINWAGVSENRNIKKAKTETSKYYLEDGSVISVKPVVTDVRRAVKQFNQFGQPLYFVTLTFSLNTEAPKALLAPQAKTATKSKKKK